MARLDLQVASTGSLFENHLASGRKAQVFLSKSIIQHIHLTKARRILILQGQLHAALEGLLNVEKQQRLAEHITGTKLACLAIIEVLYSAKDWKLLNEHILLLAKRRSQLKQVCNI